MHKYLRAIGFSGMNKNEDLQRMLQECVKNHDERKAVCTRSGREFVEYTREVASDIGLKICGETGEDGAFQMEYYFPYLKGSAISSSEEVSIERKSENEAYIGACDDMRLDITLIFSLINTGEYLDFLSKNGEEEQLYSVTLSGLCVQGKILLPMEHGADHAAERQKKVQKRAAMIMAARNGDENAIENLTVEDMDTFNEVSKRAENEDLYSIIDNCFMPYGLGTDIYSIIGDVSDVEECSNSHTGEELYKLNLLCNGIAMDVCINKKDLIGVPAPGRRFKGVVWLQGEVPF